nr:hypothetical protein [Candidatus Mycoplasma haematolamae]
MVGFFKPLACLVVGGTTLGGGIYGTVRHIGAGGGHSIAYKDKTKYCDTRAGLGGRCVFIGPIDEFQGEGIYFQEGVATNTHRIDKKDWLDYDKTDDTVGGTLKEVLNQHPGLRAYLKGWLDSHKHCDFQLKSTNLGEYKMICQRQ